jgi:hypothetical protein
MTTCSYMYSILIIFKSFIYPRVSSKFEPKYKYVDISTLPTNVVKWLRTNPETNSGFELLGF